MSATSTAKPYFVPTESIIAFVFIGVVVLGGLIARCLALNQSTTRSTQSLDLMIYKAAPRPVPVQKPKRLSIEPQSDSNSGSREQRPSSDGAVTPARVQRGPKNL
jgi:hypothetical protein